MKLSIFKSKVLVKEVDCSQEINLESPGQYLSLGRGENCNILLDDMSLSREHAKVYCEDDKWFIENLSKFGSISVNGSNSDKSILNDKDTIKIGVFTLGVSLEVADIHSQEASLEDGQEEENSDHSEQEKNQDEEMDLSGEQENYEDSTAEGDNDALGESIGDFQEDVEPEAEADNVDDSGEEFEGDFNGDDGDFSNESGEFGDDVVDTDHSEDDYALDSGDSTRIIEAFSNFKLDIFGEYAPYDTFSVEKDIIIGRDENKCDIVLLDNEVSGTHAKLTRSRSTLSLEDLQSGNGTILNGERVNNAILQEW